MIIPELENYDTYQDFFKDFYTLNKNENKIWSYRNLAKKINWPASLLNEIINGKKELSLDRALEFAKSVKLNAIETERIIFLVLSQSKQNNYKEYFADKINLHKHKRTFKNIEYNIKEEEHFEIDENIYSDITLLLIMDFLNLNSNKTITVELICDSFNIKELSEIEVIQAKVNHLEKCNLVEITKSNNRILSIKPLKKNLYFIVNKSNIHLMKQYMNLTLNNLNSSTKGWICSAFVPIPQSKIHEVIKRYEEFRSYILNIDKLKDEQSSNQLLFQLDLNLINLLNSESYNDSTFSEWLFPTKL